MYEAVNHFKDASNIATLIEYYSLDLICSTLWKE